MQENINHPQMQAPADNNSTSSGSNTKPGQKYQGDITSKEAGNIVRNMIREQEKAMMSSYEKDKAK